MNTIISTAVVFLILGGMTGFILAQGRVNKLLGTVQAQKEQLNIYETLVGGYETSLSESVEQSDTLARLIDLYGVKDITLVREHDSGHSTPFTFETLAQAVDFAQRGQPVFPDCRFVVMLPGEKTAYPFVLQEKGAQS